MSKLIDLTGMTFDALRVVGRAESHITPKGTAITMWECKCQCGKTVIATSQNLRRRHTRSCGCLFPQHNLTHGDCTDGQVSRLYNIWYQMIQRCYNAKNPKYPLYGGRGITVCDDWKGEYTKFKTWAMSNGYEENLTIDRANVNGNYSPENCRWATRREQANNTRRNVLITYDGDTKTMSEWATQYGIPYKTLWHRLNNGWEIPKAISTPLSGKGDDTQ